MGKYKDSHGYTRVQSWLGSLLGVNPESVGEELQGQIGSLLNRYTQGDLTGAQKAQNQWNMEQAVAADERQFQNSLALARETPKAQVEGMQQAGINPALMYNSSPSAPSGQGTAATGSAGAGSLSLGDLMSVVTMPMQMQMLKAQTEGVEEDNKRKKRENTIGEATMEDAINISHMSVDELSKRIAGIDLDNINKEDQHNINLLNIVRQRLENEQFEKLMPLVVEYQALQNEISRTDSRYREQQILHDLAEKEASIQSLIADADWKNEDKKYLGRYNLNQVGGTFIMGLARALGIVNEENEPVIEEPDSPDKPKGVKENFKNAFKGFKPFGFLYGSPFSY